MPSQGTALILIFIVSVIFGWMYVVAYRRENQQYKKASVSRSSVQKKGSKERGMFRAPNRKPMKWTKDIRPIINWPVLLSDEIQECLPHDKAEAITRYRKQADVEYEKAQNAIEYSIAFPGFVPPPVRLGPDRPIVIPKPEIKFDNPDWDLLLSEELQEFIKIGKTEAIKRYHQISGVELKEATDAVEYYLSHRHQRALHIRTYAVTDEQRKIIDDRLERYEWDKAVQAYQDFSGVDEATADDAVNAMRKEKRIQGARAGRLKSAMDPRWN